MDKQLEDYIDNFFNSIPRKNLTQEEYTKIAEQNRKEDAEIYSNKDEKGYLV